MTRLDGKTALITGAARGIGKAFAEHFIAEGARVAIADIDLARAQATASEIGAVAVHMDVSCEDSITESVADAIDALGQIEILINDGGTQLTMQPVVKHMIQSKICCKIINMASQGSRRGEPLVAVYCATKAAVIRLTQSADFNLIQHGINVNAIAPGVVDGKHWDGVDAFFAKHEGKAPEQKKREVGDAMPFGRMGVAEDLTGMAVFLASSEADYIVSQTYNMDGGRWMS